jgi:hypothetical protein
MTVQQYSRRRRRRSRRRPVLWALAVILLCAAASAAALLAWPGVGLGADGDALASVEQPTYAGSLERVAVHTSSGKAIAVDLRDGKLWPRRAVPPGEQLTVDVTVKRPAWAGWLVGHTARATFHVATPSAALRGRWLEVPAGKPVTVSFDQPVQRVVLRDETGPRTLRLAKPRTIVSIGVVAMGARSAGIVTVRAAPRSWEQLSQPARVSWFPARSRVQALVAPKQDEPLSPDGVITVTFSRPTVTALRGAMPTITPVVPGHWRQLDTHTVSFAPTGLGFPLSSHVEVRLPAQVDVTGTTGAGEQATRTLTWDVRHGTILRLHQLLAQTGYLPVDWSSSGAPVARTAAAQVAAVSDPPAGHFSWPYAATTPKELKGIWRTFEWNEITRGAVMMFEHDHDLEVDAFVGPKVWHALLAGKRRTGGYSYVYVHRNVPQLLTLWHDGKTILTSPGNTGVPAAPTELGTFPVFEHIRVGTMSGTNPDGSHYNDPGIRWISYFNHGEALHAFPRASFGTPQSLGCVELPLAAAAKVWPYTPIGTLVTVEN